MIKVTPVPAFNDNYLWMVEGTEPGNAAVVDPGDAAPIEAWLTENGRTLTSILITHHHADHVGGVERLKESYPAARVFGPDDPRISMVEEKLSDNDKIQLEDLGLEFKVLFVPGHTSHHIAYLGHGSLFCGDTMFAGGCGRVFCGTMKDLNSSLQRLSKLPDETLVYCAHEYTMANIAFARMVEGDENTDLVRREKSDADKRAIGIPTVPTTIGVERKTNPFLRVDEPLVKKIAEQKAGTQLLEQWQVFEALRLWKDQA